MRRVFTVVFAMFCCGILCASPYGRALKQARKVADQKHRYDEPRRPQPRKPAPAPADEFSRIWGQMNSVIRQNKGYLPGPAGVAGLRKICGPGRVSPALLKINDFGKLTERNCAWAYVGGAVGVLRSLPKGGNFPILFAKPAPGVRQIKVLLADGQVRMVDARQVRNCTDVVSVLRRESRHGKHPAWKNLSIAAGQIDRARR